MYFTNIANTELQYFHGLTVPNFSISLSEIVNDNTGLFRVETMGDIYKIYPLFYCNMITSSNSSDKVLENKCIITSEDTSETYFNFLSGTGEVFSFNFIRNFYSISDSLTDEEFNALVTLYRHGNSFTDTININNSNISGAYADYQFDLESTTIVDNGVLITQETLSNIGTVRLLNPVFPNSSYVLSLKVYSIEDVIVGFDTASNIEVTTLNVPLVENTDVSIPFNTLELNNVVGFDATVDITHDKGVIGYVNHLSLSGPATGIVLSPLELSVTLDESGTPVSGATVTFYDDTTSIGTAVTNSNGVATLSYTPNTAKEYKFNVKYGDAVSNRVSTVISKAETNIILSTDKTLGYIPTTFSITGVLTVNNTLYDNVNVKLYDDETLLDTLTTDNDGEFSYTISDSIPTTHELYAVFEGDSIGNASTSNYVSLTARKLNMNLSLNANRTTVYFVSQNVTLSGVLTDELGNTINGATITLKGESSDVTTTTNSSGAYSFTRTSSSVATYNYYVVYDGDSSHETVSSATKTVNYKKAPTSVAIYNAQSEYEVGDNMLIRASSNYGTFNPTSIDVYIEDYVPTITTKDNDGNFIFTIPGTYTGNRTLTIKYNGDDNYASSSRSVDIIINNTAVDTLSVSKSSGNLVINAKKNGSNVANLDLDGLTIYVSNPSSSIRFTEGQLVTNSSGNASFNMSIIFNNYDGTLYVTYGGVTSNTLSY